MIDLTKSILSPAIKHLDSFYHDVVTGLSAPQKYLHSKYFYDATGDLIFQQIMKCPEYYLTPCEMEILAEQSQDMVRVVNSYGSAFDVVELGPGDASKSFFLLQELVKRRITDTYYPIDISGNMIRRLEANLPIKINGLTVGGLRGDYMERLKETKVSSCKNRLVLFMGASIGNFTTEEATEFCVQVRDQLLPGDLFMIGFDLKKNTDVILDAYNDKDGITKQFNLNLLTRINRELDADFNVKEFEHSPTYDPITGACKSYLISTKEQEVNIGEEVRIHVSKSESIYMEISQKYTVEQINNLATISGFIPVMNFFDSRGWFVDVLWRCNKE